MTGVNVLNVFTVVLLTGLKNSGAHLFLTPAKAATTVGVVGFFANIIAPPVISKFSRKALFQFGHFTNMIWFIIAGYGVRIKNGNLVLIMIYCFEITYNISNGALFWVYAAEITVNDKAMGMTACVRMMTLFILSLITLPIIDKVGYEPFFYFFGFF